VPVTVTAYVPWEPLQESVDVPETTVALTLILVGLRLQVRPVLGAVEFDRDIVPVNPFRPVTIIVDMPV
jgi:hypothetical protein